MNLLYSIPLPLLFVFMLTLCFLLGISGVWITRSLNCMVENEDNDAVTLTHAFAGVLYAVALGLMVVNVQSGYTEVKLVVMQEANFIEELFINAHGLSGESGSEIQEITTQYTDAIIDEWQNIGSTLDSELPSHEYAEALTRAVLNHKPASEKEFIIYSQVFNGLNTLLEKRRERLHLGRDGVGPVTWFVVAIGALITIGMTCFYRTHSARTHYSLVGVMSIMFGLMIFLIVAMDYPLLGKFSVDNTPFQEAKTDMSVWSRNWRT